MCRQSRQMRPELMTCRTESVLVPYKFFSYSPDSMNFPVAKSASNAERVTKWYSRPFRSCILGLLVVSEPLRRTDITVLHFLSFKLSIYIYYYFFFKFICVTNSCALCDKLNGFTSLLNTRNTFRSSSEVCV